MKRIICALAMLAVAESPALGVAGGSFIDGYQLLERCREDSATCYSYIEGVVDGFGVTNELPCLPAMRLGQAKIIIQGYLDAHPESLHLTAASLAWAALDGSFRCGRARR